MNLLTLISTIVTTFIYLIYCFAISPSLSLLIIITGIILASFLSLLYKITKAIGIKIGPLLSKQQVICQKPLTVFKPEAEVLENFMESKFNNVVNKIEILNRLEHFCHIWSEEF